MRMVESMLGLLLTFLVTLVIVTVSIAFLFGLGLIAGHIVHWLVPAISLEAGFIAGVLAAIPTYYILYRALMYSAPKDSADENADSSGVRDNVIYVLDSFDLSQRRRRRSSRRKSPPPD